MKLQPDTKQRIFTTLSMFTEFYKVMMGTFLTIFVPQQCDEGVCTLSQNFYNTELLHRSAMILNFVTFVSVLTFYGIEIRRENWCIKYLDIDDNLSNNNLDTEIEFYPKYKKEMNKLNKYYLYSLYTSAILLLANFGYSGYSISYDYTGPNTITSILSFFMLVTNKLYTAVGIGKESVKNERAFSAYMRTPKTYNTIDEDFKLEEVSTTEVKLNLE